MLSGEDVDFFSELEGSEGLPGSMQRAEGYMPRCQATVEEYEKLE
jgi:hypothetical protein